MPVNLPVWMYWEGECPPWINACIGTVFAHAPNVRLLTLADFDAMRDVDRDIDLTRLSATHRSDFIRAFLLAKYGGLWIDTDCVVLRSLQPVLDMLSEYDFLGYNERQGHIASNFIGARQGSQIAAAYYQRDCTILRTGQYLHWLTLASYALDEAIVEVGIPWMRLEHSLVQPVCWSAPEAFFTIRNRQEHAQIFNDASFCYMLANTMIKQFQAANPTQDLMDKDSFFSYLLDKAAEDSKQADKPDGASPAHDPAGGETNQAVHPIQITAYPLYEQAVAITPTPNEAAWAAALGSTAAGLALSSAGGKSWNLLCPYAFAVTWNGGPSPEDIAIQLDAPDADAPDFVQSQLGTGLLTFYPGYQFKTEAEQTLWVRGPINRPKDGVYPLEQIIDTSLLPCTIAVTWQCLRPNHTIRFEQGEPFGTILLYAKSAPENPTLNVVTLNDDAALDAYEQAFQVLAERAAAQGAFEHLGEIDAEATLPEQAHASSHAAAQRSDHPPVSCICPTYGRVELLEEAIESFLRQDYPGQKELIILNDYDQQTLVFEHPEVRIINVPKRFSSVGEKYKAAAALCAYDLLFVWDDDDICLPHRLSLSVTQFDHTRGFFKASSAWFWNNGQLSGPERNIFHGGSCFSRELFVAVRGYPHTSSGFDIGFEQMCEELRAGATKGQPLAPEDLYYLYRWAGTGSYHLSAAGRNGQAHAAVAAYVQEWSEWGKITSGQIILNPHWETDYTTLVQNYLATPHADMNEGCSRLTLSGVEQMPSPEYAEGSAE